VRRGAHGVRRGLERTFRSLHEPNYRRFFVGHSVSVVGTWMQRVAQDWLVLTLTGSGVALGISTALQFGPVLVLGLWGGTVVDRVDRRKLVMLTQVVQAVLAAALGVLALSGVVELWMVYVSRSRSGSPRCSTRRRDRRCSARWSRRTTTSTPKR
jgi:MFS family permease